MSGPLAILHTNDLHGRLTAAQAAWLARRKTELAPCLLLDSGDCVGSGNLLWRPGGEPAHRLLAGAGYDALALGNREFQLWGWSQRWQLAACRCPTLCANLRPAGFGGLTRWVTLAAGEWRVAVCGLLRSMVNGPAKRLSRARFVDPVIAVREFVATTDAPVKICLSHLGLAADRALAEAEPELTLILGGHSHHGLRKPELVAGVPIFQNEPYGRTVTEIVLEQEAERITWTYRVRPLGEEETP